MTMLKMSMIKAGKHFFKGSPTIMCMHKAPSIIKETTRAVGKTNNGIHNPKRSSSAELILRNPIT
jgi:hypothetical protein